MRILVLGALAIMFASACKRERSEPHATAICRSTTVLSEERFRRRPTSRRMAPVLAMGKVGLAAARAPEAVVPVPEAPASRQATLPSRGGVHGSPAVAALQVRSSDRGERRSRAHAQRPGAGSSWRAPDPLEGAPPRLRPRESRSVRCAAPRRYRPYRIAAVLPRVAGSRSRSLAVLDHLQGFARVRRAEPIAGAHSWWQAAGRPEVWLARHSASDHDRACLLALAKA
jgi:hypothetical protein